MDKFSVLKQFFGYDSFREGQEQLVDALLSGRDCVGIMPTGAGKSLCFQVPSLLLDGITIVISPLISLMKDQVVSLIQSGVKAAYLNSSLTLQQYNRVMNNAISGVYKIIYVAPERLNTPDFLRFSQLTDISMVCVDEAHCISQWGQDFRPSYLKIAEFIKTLKKRPVIGAFTATATDRVKNDIINHLKLDNPIQVVTGFDRKNLYFEVREPFSKNVELLTILDKYKDKNVIVYCSTRKNVESVCELLCENGFEATRYHAGLEDDERKGNQEDFLFDRKNIMVATNAFGMGIDKSDVSCVVHYNMPKDVESYYQEAGRAGRDGSSAKCILLFSGKDIITNKFLIENSNENEEVDEQTAQQLKKIKLERLERMAGYCRTVGCLRGYILNYFGEKTSACCDNCSNCCSGVDVIDRTVEAQKILSCIKRAGEHYGAGMIVKILRGEMDERIASLGFDSLSTFGIMQENSEKEIRLMINGLIEQGYIEKTQSEYPVLMLTQSSYDILFKGKTVMLRRATEKQKQPRAVKPKPSMRSAQSYEELSYLEQGLFDQLKKLRLKIARTNGLPAFVVFTDSTLCDMAAKKPLTEEELLNVSGVSRNKYRRYGEKFLKLITEYLGENG